jgi:hypothetical protein
MNIVDILGNVIDYARENPIKCAVVATATLATGGLAYAFAAPIAATLGSAGLLGVSSTGTAIGSLSGAALEAASLAALGGGSVAAGGVGVAGGTAVVSATGVLAGGVASGGIAAATS